MPAALRAVSARELPRYASILTVSASEAARFFSSSVSGSREVNFGSEAKCESAMRMKLPRSSVFCLVFSSSVPLPSQSETNILTGPPRAVAFTTSASLTAETKLSGTPAAFTSFCTSGESSSAKSASITLMKRQMLTMVSSEAPPRQVSTMRSASSASSSGREMSPFSFQENTVQISFMMSTKLSVPAMPGAAFGAGAAAGFFCAGTESQDIADETFAACGFAAGAA